MFHSAAVTSCRLGSPKYKIAAILANAARCEYEMELNRKCLKTCDDALEADPECLKAYLLKGQAQLALGKSSRAILTWKAALEGAKEYSDSDVVGAIERELSLNERHKDVSDPAAVRKLSTLENTEALRREAISAPVAAAAAAAAEKAAHDAGSPGSSIMVVTDSMLTAARNVLSHSSGVISLDNTIARGYLLVNTGEYVCRSFDRLWG